MTEPRPTRVLVIDDDEEDFMTTRSLLGTVSNGQLRLEWVSTYDDGLAALRLGEHDAYLVDYRLGERDGLELVRAALEGGCEAPVILLTGQGDHEVDRAALEAGAADYLVKGSVDGTLLERAIRYAIEQKRAEHALRRLHTELETRVAERTAALTSANAALEAEIQERQRTEEALRDSEARLRQSQKMEAIGRLAGGVAHDFNNLLAVINGYTDLILAREAVNGELRSPLGEIREAGERAVMLVRQLLAFGRRQVLRPEVLDVNDVVTGVHKLLRRLIGEDVEIVLVPGAAAGLVRADQSQLEQVLINLAVNARDAMPRGGRLTIETRSVRVGAAERRRGLELAPGPYVAVAVRDTGSGIDPETRAHLFEPFFTTKDEGKGTGLGLATVYGIVQQSSGDIEVESEPGQGTLFRFYLPQVQAAASATEARPRAPAPRGSETILLVEDEPMVRHLVRDALQLYGYTVLEAPHGEEALRLCKAHAGPIHLLLTDVVMPGGMNGRELAERLQPERPAMKLLYMSGYTDDSVVVRGVRTEATDFLQKPFTPDFLARRVRELLDAR